MPEAWITPDYINEPKPGKKMGNIKTKELGYIWMKPEGLGQFRKGQRVYIEYSESGDGFKNLVKFPNPPQPQSQQAAPTGTGYNRSMQQAPVPKAMAPQSSLQTIPAGLDITALNIFCTGIVGRALGSGHFQASDIPDLTAEAKKAFLQHLSGSFTAQEATRVPSHNHPDMDDPLPHPDQYGIQEAIHRDPRDDSIPF